MIGIRHPNQRHIITGLLVFSLLAAGSPGARAALLDGRLDTVEESLADSLAKNNERLTTGNFYTDDKPNAHGPIGMMGDHTHEAGEFMFSYRFMHMFMEGTRYGTTRLNNAEAFELGRRHPNLSGGTVPTGPYGALPESMRMMMHMIGAMYGWNDTVTLTVMVPYILKSMKHVTGRGGKFTTRSEGVGDVRFGSLWRLWAIEAPSIGAHRFHANLSVSVPTGNIQPTDNTPLGANSRLPYPMHLGSGTFDFYPGITYGGEKGRASWGLQTIGTLRASNNYHGFSKGDAYVVNIHGAYEVINSVMSGSVRLSWNHWNAHNGVDRDIGRIRYCEEHIMGGSNRCAIDNIPADFELEHTHAIVQTAFPATLGGQRLDILFGVNVLLPEIMGLENRLAVEGGVPVYQYLDGQLETDSIITFGWQSVY